MQDIKSDLSIKEALAREESFFRNHPVGCNEFCYYFSAYFLLTCL